MSLDISEQTEFEVRAKTAARGLSVDEYLRQLLHEAGEQEELIASIEQGLRDDEAGRVHPAPEALPRLGAKFSFSR